jgi:hypothetical protein
MYHSRGWVLLLLVLVVFAGGGMVWQRNQAALLQAEVELLRAEHRELAPLRGENERLTAGQVPPGELDALRTDHAELVRLRGEVEAARLRAQSAAVEIKLADAARGSADAVLASAVEAVTNGDINTLAGTLGFEGAAQEKADALYNGLPDAVRAQYASPAQLIALMIAKDVPPGKINMIGRGGYEDNADRVTARVRLQPADGPAKIVQLLLRRQDDNWKIMVPASAVEKYTNALKGVPTADR